MRLVNLSGEMSSLFTSLYKHVFIRVAMMMSDGVASGKSKGWKPLLLFTIFHAMARSRRLV